MNDKSPAAIDRNDDEPASGAHDSGPLGTLVDSSSSPNGVEDTPEALNRPSQPSTVSGDYAKGTREHHDDREG